MKVKVYNSGLVESYWFNLGIGLWLTESSDAQRMACLAQGHTCPSLQICLSTLPVYGLTLRQASRFDHVVLSS